MKTSHPVQLLALLGGALVIASSQAQPPDPGVGNDPLGLLNGNWIGHLRCGPYLGTAKVSDQRRRPFQGNLTMAVRADGSAAILREGTDFSETSSGSISPDLSLRTVGEGRFEKSDAHWVIQYAGQYTTVAEKPGFVGTAQLSTPIGEVLRECTFVASRREEQGSPSVNVGTEQVQAHDAAIQSDESHASVQQSLPRNAPDDGSSIFSTVTTETRPFYHGPGVFALGGAVGAAIGAVASKDEPDRIAQFVSREAIDFPAMLKSEFERQLKNDAAARLAYEKNGPAKFRMAIKYGITSVPFSDYRPYLSIKMKLVDAKGDEKWSDREYVGGFGKAKPLPYLDFFKSRQVFMDEFETAANEVVTLLLHNLSR